MKIINGWGNEEEVKGYRVFDRRINDEGRNTFKIRGENVTTTNYIACFSSKEYPHITWAYFGETDSIDYVYKQLDSCRERSGLPFELPLTGDLDMDLFESIVGFSETTEVWCINTIDYVDYSMSRGMYFILRRSI